MHIFRIMIMDLGSIFHLNKLLYLWVENVMLFTQDSMKYANDNPL